MLGANIMYTKNPNGSFSVFSRSNPKIVWIVSSNMESCNCPKFKYITKGKPCHHIDEVIAGEMHLQITGDFPKFDIKNYTTPLPVVDFLTLYGEEQLDHLVKIKTLLLHHNMVRRL